MLSERPIKSVQHADHYFLEKDNYYLDGTHIQTQWLGRGAQRLGLAGEVSRSAFGDLLSGKLPSGQQLGVMKAGRIEHRPGYDLTFSAPKSVSVLSEVFDDKRVHLAHEKAILAAFEMVEDVCAQARKTTQGKTVFENTDNLVAASFRHDLSRDNDPQLHTHCVVMNMTQRQDGQWRSLASDLLGYHASPTGFLERVRKHKLYLGMVYRANLAYELTQLGYEINKTHDDGRFEVVGVEPSVIDEFSSRRQDIEAFLKERGWQGAHAASFATLETRAKKMAVERAQLKELWKKSCRELGFEGEKLVEQAKERVHARSFRSQLSVDNPGIDIPAMKAASLAVRLAIDHYSEQAVSFSYLGLLNTAILECVGQSNPRDVVKALQEALDKGDIVCLASKGDEKLFTTPGLIEQEKQWLRHFAHNQFQVLPWHTQLEVKRMMKPLLFSNEQQCVFEAMATSYDRITLLAGVSGSGKTHLLSQYALLAVAEKKQTIYLTPNKIQAENAKHLFAQTQSVYGFLQHQKEGRLLHKPDLIMIDDAQSLGIKPLITLCELAHAWGARVVIAGNDKNMLGFGGSAAFEQCLSIHPHALRLESRYGEALTPIHASVNAMAKGNIGEAMTLLSSQLIEKSDPEDKMAAMVKQYAFLSKDDPWQTRLITSTKKHAKELNKAIRATLKKSGVLSTHEKTVTIHIPHYLSGAQRGQAKHYQVGWMLQFHSPVSSLPLSATGCYDIVALDKEKNQLMLSNGSHDTKTVSLTEIGDSLQNMTIFSKESRSFVVGEHVRALASNATQGLIAGEKFLLHRLYKHSLVLEKQDRTRLVIPIKATQPLLLDYGYATTPQIHHTPVNYMISDMKAHQVKQRRVYQELGQTKKNIWIYTDNAKTFAEQLANEKERPTSAVGALLHEKSILPTPEMIHPLTPARSYLNALETQCAFILQRLPKGSLDNFKQFSVEELAQHCAKTAISILSEKEAAFTHEALMMTAMRKELGNVPTAALKKAIDDARHNGLLVQGTDPTERLWTTPQAIICEKEIIDMVNIKRNTTAPIFSPIHIDDRLSSTHLQADQRQAAKQILTCHDQFMLLQAVAGTGKTALMETVAQLAGLAPQKISLQGIAPTHEAVKELSARGIPSQTLSSFLIDIQKPQAVLQTPSLFVLDEASMVTNKDMHQLLRWFSQHQHRLVMMGDQGQLLAVGDGKPFSILQAIPDVAMTLTQIKRQAPQKTALREAISQTLQHNYTSAFDALDRQKENLDMLPRSRNACIPQIIEMKQDALFHMSQDYLARTPSERAHTLLITPANKDRCRMNELVRQGLKEQGVLAPSGVIATILEAKHLSATERLYSQYYDKGDLIRFNQRIDGLPVTKDTVVHVLDKDVTFNMLHLQKKDGMRFSWCIPQSLSGPLGVEVYTQSTREVCVGELIRWRRSDREQGLLGGALGSVSEINAHTMTLSFKNGKMRVIELSDPQMQHWDYAYASTTHLVQGKTQQDILTYLDASSKTTTSRNFYTMITRACHEVTIWTNDKQKALHKIMNDAGDKTSALEAIGWFERDKLALPTEKVSIKASKKEQATFSQWDSIQIKSRLTERTEEIVLSLLGKPNKANAREWRYGSGNASFCVAMQGVKRGLWHDFQLTESGGDLLSLVAYCHGLITNKMDYPKVLDIAATLLGMSEQEKIMCIKQDAHKSISSKPDEIAFDAQKRITKAQHVASQSIAIKGTLAERYLREHRLITGTLGEDLKFHPGLYSSLNQGKFPALIAIARNEQGDIQAVQATYLDPLSANKAEVEVKKQTFGLLKGARVLLQFAENKECPVLYCEGVETGLSLKEADLQKNIYAVLGISNFKTIPVVSQNPPVILCLDNDGDNVATKKLVIQACDRLVKEGVRVYTNQPMVPKTDYNDLLKQQGIEAIKQALTQSYRFESTDILKSTPIEKDIAQVALGMTHEPLSFRDKLNAYHQQQSSVINEQKTAADGLSDKHKNKCLDQEPERSS